MGKSYVDLTLLGFIKFCTSLAIIGVLSLIETEGSASTNQWFLGINTWGHQLAKYPFILLEDVLLTAVIFVVLNPNEEKYVEVNHICTGLIKIIGPLFRLSIIIFLTFITIEHFVGQIVFTFLYDSGDKNTDIYVIILTYSKDYLFKPLSTVCLLVGVSNILINKSIVSKAIKSVGVFFRNAPRVLVCFVLLIVIVSTLFSDFIFDLSVQGTNYNGIIGIVVTVLKFAFFACLSLIVNLLLLTFLCAPVLYYIESENELDH